MAFNNVGSLDQKQRVNLSYTALSIIENDRICFGVENITKFYNRIFMCFKEDALASRAIALDKQRKALEMTFAKLEKETKDKVIDTLVSEYEMELKRSVDHYPKGESQLFRLNNQNFQYLTEPNSSCREDEYYGNKMSLYLKAVFEEYAWKPYVLRERIYFSDVIEKAEMAIQLGLQLRVELKNNSRFYIKPYRVMSDKMDTYNYLVGCSRSDKTPEADFKPASFRVTRMINMEMIKKGKSGRLTQGEKNSIDYRISTEGPQFLVGDTVVIRIRLTDTGVRKYREHLFLRPPYQKKIDAPGVYDFYCTEAQAEFYFMKFGRDAEILSPEILRDRMVRLYRDALDSYRL